MAKVKLQRTELSEFHDFDEKDFVAGKVIDYREISTKFGAGMVLDLATSEGEKTTIMVTAALKGYPWAELAAAKTEVEIKAIGWGKGKNGRFRDFEVSAEQ